MNMSNAAAKPDVKVLKNQKEHRGFMLDAEGKEVQITTDMVRNVCTELLKQCRNIKN